VRRNGPITRVGGRPCVPCRTTPSLRGDTVSERAEATRQLQRYAWNVYAPSRAGRANNGKRKRQKAVKWSVGGRGAAGLRLAAGLEDRRPGGLTSTTHVLAWHCIASDQRDRRMYEYDCPTSSHTNAAPSSAMVRHRQPRRDRPMRRVTADLHCRAQSMKTGREG